MADLFMRDDAPLTPAEWAALDETVVNTARKQLVGRRFVPVAGPFGPGTQVVPVGAGADRTFVPIATIQHDLALAWTDIEASRQYGTPLELGPAAAAAAACARDEDRLVLDGLLNAAGILRVPLSNWADGGSAFVNIVQATSKLVEADVYGPYAVVMAPAHYATLHRMMGHGAGRMEIQMIRETAAGGVFQSPVLPPDQVLVVSVEPQNFDLTIAQDLVTAYLGPEGLDHTFRVLEKLALRIKRPAAICLLSK